MLPTELKRQAGSLIVGGFDGLSPNSELLRRLASGELGGVIVFKRNIDSPAQVAALNAAIGGTGSTDHPILIAVDQEGGSVARLRGIITDLPPMSELGRLNDPHLCAKVGELLGAELRALGFNVNFAPVVDVNTNPHNPVIGSRSFSSDPQKVGRLGVALAEGMLVSGIVPCLKHFPGHGDTEVDSHVDLPTIHHDIQRLATVEWPPFVLGIQAKLPLIMTAHVRVVALDPELPATLSRTIISGTLRNQLGFQGCVVTDDLEMAAVADRYPIDEMIELGLVAGVDLFLICQRVSQQRKAYQTLIHLGERSSTFREKIRASATRVQRLRTLVGTNNQSTIDWKLIVKNPKHTVLIDNLRQRLAESDFRF